MLLIAGYPFITEKDEYDQGTWTRRAGILLSEMDCACEGLDNMIVLGSLKECRWRKNYVRIRHGHILLPDEEVPARSATRSTIAIIVFECVLTSLPL